MSNLDKVNTRTLNSCCVATVHARPGIGAEDDTTECRCGKQLTVMQGIWTSEGNSNDQ